MAGFQSSENTPLHDAATSGSVEIVAALVDHGADMYAENDVSIMGTPYGLISDWSLSDVAWFCCTRYRAYALIYQTQ